MLEPVNKKPKRCNATVIHKGNAVIYCDDAFLGDEQEIDAKDLRTYFLNKLLGQTVKYCNFISTIADIKDYTQGMHELKESKDSELDVIKSILSK